MNELGSIVHLLEGIDIMKSAVQTSNFNNLMDTLKLVPDEKIEHFGGYSVKDTERIVVKDIVNTVFTTYLSNPMAFAVALSHINIKKPTKIKGYSALYSETLDKMKALFGDIHQRITNDESMKQYYAFFNDDGRTQEYIDFLESMENAEPILQDAVKADRLCNDGKLSNAEFLEKILPINDRMIENLVLVTLSVNQLGRFKDFYSENLCKSADYLCFVNRFLIGEQKLLEDKAQNQAIKPKTETTPRISESEQERLNLINSVNDKYNEFCMDTMRDLQTQVPYSVKDMYNTLLDKFENFISKFTMPLSNNVSLGQAREAGSQLDRLIEYVSKISENATVSVVYGNEIQKQ